MGVGHWGANILRDLRTLGATVRAVARSAASRDRALAGGAHQIVACVEDLAGVDGVVVATTIRSHAEVVEEVLELGVPVFVEKPFTDDPEAARRLTARAGARLFVMDKWRYHAGIAELAQIARSGEIGAIVGLRCTRLSWDGGHLPDADVWVLAPHDLAIALEVLGHVPRPRCAVGHVLPSGNDALVAILGEQPWLVLDVGGTAHLPRRQVELVGTDGLAWLDDGWADHIGVAQTRDVGADTWERRPLTGELPLLAELRAFLHHVAGGPPPRSSAAEGAEIVEAVACLRELAGLPLR